MSSTPEEFRRGLVQAFGDAVSDEKDGLLLASGDARLYFALCSETPKRMGALELALLRVEISVLEGDARSVSELLARVDRATLRGGG